MCPASDYFSFLCLHSVVTPSQVPMPSTADARDCCTVRVKGFLAYQPYICAIDIHIYLIFWML